MMTRTSLVAALFVPFLGAAACSGGASLADDAGSHMTDAASPGDAASAKADTGPATKDAAAAKDTSVPEQVVMLAAANRDPCGIAVDQTSVYWMNGPAVMRVAKGGGTAVTLALGDWACSDLAVDDASLYWHGGMGKDLLKIPLKGGAPVTLASIEGSPTMLGLVAVDDVSVYWAAGTDVMKVARGGGTATTLASNTTILARSLAVHGADIYWLADGVEDVAISGGQPHTLVHSPGSGYYGIAADGANVYWTSGTTPHGTVMKLAVAGGVPVTLASEQKAPNGIVVDDANVYWTNNSAGGAVMKVAIAGGTPVTLATGQAFPYGITVDAKSVYWTNFGDSNQSNGAVMKATPK
jgi:hypothetical protein